MYCNKCGSKLNEHDTICSNCGSIIEKGNIPQTSNRTVSLGNLYNTENIVNQNNRIQSQTNVTNQNYNNQSQVNGENNYQKNIGNTMNGQKKKNYWLIPLKLFLAGIACNLISFIIRLILYAGENNTISTLFLSLYFILELLVLPSIVYAIIKSNAKSKNKQENEFNNNINNFSTLEEKMIQAYIGNNYTTIKNKKFNFSAWFFNVFYILYRKMYIQGILLFLCIFILYSLPSSEISMILVSILFIVIGFMFNKIYVNYVKKQINLIRKNNSNCSEEGLINICKNKGGTNAFIAIVLLIVLSTISSTIYQHFNMIHGDVGDENNGYVLEYSLPQIFEKSEYNDSDSKAYYLKSDDIDDINDICSVGFSYIKGSIMDVYSGEYHDYNSASDFITAWYCENNADSCDIKSIDINSNVWYYLETEDAYKKSSIYVHNDKNKLYRVSFTIPNDSSKKQKCSDYKQTIIESLKFVEK